MLIHMFDPLDCGLSRTGFFACKDLLESLLSLWNTLSLSVSIVVYSWPGQAAHFLRGMGCLNALEKVPQTGGLGVLIALSTL